MLSNNINSEVYKEEEISDKFSIEIERTSLNRINKIEVDLL